MIHTGRTCASCGVAGVRWKVGDLWATNLNPITGECLDCTVKRSREEAPPAAEPVERPLLPAEGDDAFDAKAQQSP